MTTNSVTVPYRTFYDECFIGDVIKLQIKARDTNGQWSFSEHYVTFVDSPIDKPVLVSPVLPTDETTSFPVYGEDENLTIAWKAVPEGDHLGKHKWNHMGNSRRLSLYGRKISA